MSSLRFWAEVRWVGTDHQWDAVSTSPGSTVSIQQGRVGDTSGVSLPRSSAAPAPLWGRGGARSSSWAFEALVDGREPHACRVKRGAPAKCRVGMIKDVSRVQSVAVLTATGAQPIR